ncbi:MAG: hypothetical protein ACT4OJ_05880 [Bacteroidota bacterium]
MKTADAKSTTLFIGIGPFLRYYFKNVDKSFFYTQLSAGINKQAVANFENKSYNGTTGALTGTSKTNADKKYSFFNVSASVGWNYFFRPNFALNMSLGYNYMKDKSSTSSTFTPASVVPVPALFLPMKPKQTV